MPEITKIVLPLWREATFQGGSAILSGATCKKPGNPSPRYFGKHLINQHFLASQRDLRLKTDPD